MQQPRFRTLALLVTLLTFALVQGCSSGGSDEDQGTPAADGSGQIAPGDAALGIADLAFEPSTLTVASGSTDVTVTNADSTDHTFTLDDGSVDQAVAAGETVTVTVDITASVGFHCEIHPSMTGTLQVA